MALQGIRERTLRFWLDGRGEANDRLWLMTDALAQWCLAEHETSKNPWAKLDSFVAHPEVADHFTAWVEELRDNGRLHNDDVTLVGIVL